MLTEGNRYQICECAVQLFDLLHMCELIYNKILKIKKKKNKNL